jgi:hypothetical protein
VSKEMKRAILKEIMDYPHFIFCDDPVQNKLVWLNTN